MYDYVFWDLDGTLTDSGLGITNCVSYALEKFGIVEEDRTKLFPFIGPALIDSFQEFYQFPEEQAKEAVKYYRERYNTIGLFENEVYDGVVPVLQKLCEQGKKLVLATAKPEYLATEIMEHFELSQYFTFMAGSKEEIGRKSKGDVIQFCLDSLGIEDTNNVIMVGDRKHDILGAREKDIDCIAVLYGYGDRAEFEAHGARYIVETPDDVLNIITK